MRTASRTLIVCMTALLALAGTAAATPGGPSCPECHTQPVPIKNDCGYSSVKEGQNNDVAKEAGKAEACVAKAHHKDGFWAKIGLCFSAIAKGFANMLGMDANADAYVSQDGVDVDGGLKVAGHDVDLDKSPVGKLDDKTWEAASTVHGKVDKPLKDAGVDTRDMPVGGDSLPQKSVDLCKVSLC